MFEAGNILEATNKSPNAGVHYIIYLEPHGINNFIGGMITTRSFYRHVRNIPLQPNHMESTDELGNNYKIRYLNTHLVPALLHKPWAWKPFTKVGKLTNEGLGFVCAYIGHLALENFEEYEDRNFEI